MSKNHTRNTSHKSLRTAVEGSLSRVVCQSTFTRLIVHTFQSMRMIRLSNNLIEIMPTLLWKLAKIIINWWMINWKQIWISCKWITNHIKCFKINRNTMGRTSRVNCARPANNQFNTQLALMSTKTITSWLKRRPCPEIPTWLWWK